LKAKDIRALLI